MNKAFFVVGNFGVGKSTIISDEIISKQDIFLKVGNNTWVVGNNINGMDSLVETKKELVIQKIIKNNDKNLIICGIYYSQLKDIDRLKPYFDIVIIYLKTSFENNVDRILKRGKNINVKTYNEKLKSHLSLLKYARGKAKIYIIDNNREQSETKKDYQKIVYYEKN